MNAYGLHGLQSVALTTDNPPSDQMPKIQGGTLTINFENLSHLKKNKGHTYYKFSKFESLEKKTRGDPYYKYSKFESPEKIKQGGPLLSIFEI